MSGLSNKNLNIFLSGGSNSTFRLEFEVFSHPAAQKWAHCIERASVESRLAEADRWYNFPGTKMGSLSEIATALNDVIHKINQIHPNLISEPFDSTNAQVSINRLHLHFADSHLVKGTINESSYKLWQEFNLLLHAFESVKRSNDLEVRHQIPNASMIFTWIDNFKVNINSEDYQEFTIAKKFGTCYVNYCQVGRHIFEAFQADDLDLSKEHLRPLEFISADTYVWFGPSTGPKGLLQKMVAIEQWFKKNEAFFASLNMKWGDPALAIGWIPVASLKKPPMDIEEQKRLLQKIGEYTQIVAITIV